VKTEYERLFPAEAATWGRRKLRQWTDTLKDSSLSPSKRQEIEEDISYMGHLIARLEAEIR
jgi:hypothetical protein